MPRKRRPNSTGRDSTTPDRPERGAGRNGPEPRDAEPRAPRSGNRAPSRNSWFTRFAKATSRATGRPIAFAVALGVIIVWAATGPMFHYSDTWQLVINTGTTIITFLMVFLIQNTQNRDSEAAHLKLDELIRALQGAHNALLDLEDLDDKELDKIRETYAELAETARKLLRGRGVDTGTPDVRSVKPSA